MRKFTLSLITLVFFIGAAGVAPAAHADQGCSAECELGTLEGIDQCVRKENNTISCDPTKAAATAKASAANAAANDASAKIATEPNFKSDILASVMTFIMGLFAWLLGVAMVTLDSAVYYTVVTMGNYVKELPAVGVAWRILRDLGNIMLIFGFLAIGITTILNVDWYGGGKKMLPMLLVAAVFLNFSLFISEAVVDTGNLFATHFYTQINGGVPAGSKSKGSISNEAISGKIMSQLGLQTIYGDALKGGNSVLFKAGNVGFIGFMGIILFIVTAFVMFSLAFILIARFVALIFLIILAPIGFAGLAVPQLASTAKKWWDALFEQTITAPVLLLLLYIALSVITDTSFLRFGGPPPDYTGFVQKADGSFNLTGFASSMLSFLVAMGLLLAVAIFAKKLSAFGSGLAMKGAGKLTGFLSFGAASLAGRGTFGTAGYLLNNKYFQARAAKGGLGGYAARAAAFTGRNLENKTFDVRNIPGVRTAGATVGGLAAGSGIEGVFAGGSARTAKTVIDATREGIKYVKPFSGDWWRNQTKEYEKAATELERKGNIANPNSPQFAETIKKMSADELAELRGIRKGLDNFAGALSPAKYAEVQKSDKLLASEKANLKNTWETQFKGGKAKATLSRFSTEEIASLDGALIAQPDVIENLGTTEFEAIRRKGSLNAAQRKMVYASMMAAPAGSSLAAEVKDYFNPVNDLGGNRKKYWNI